MKRAATLEMALRSLVPSADWIIEDGVLTWLSAEVVQPTQQQVDAEVARIQAIFDAEAYKDKRVAEYPPITDYIDGVVKGDQAQIDAYIAACQAVKAKYPKPE